MPMDDAQQELLDRYVDAFERYDMDSLTSLIHEDAMQSMPPYELWLRGRDEILAFWQTQGAACAGSRLVPTVANGKPAFGQYRPSTTGDGHDPWALQILDIVDGELVELSFFLDTETLFPLFGLPSSSGRLSRTGLGSAGSRGLPMPAAPSRNTKDSNADPPANGNGDGPRRSSLVQERSRRTRQELVNAAVKLWTERGFEHGVENTTVEEIARAAGVTKGTFYFHFAHKEDVLLEMSLTTSDAVTAIARRSAESGATIDEIVQQAFTEMARRTERLPAPRSRARSGSSTSTPPAPAS